MNKQWVENKKNEAIEKYEKLKPIFIKNVLENFTYLKKEDVEEMLSTCISKDSYDVKICFSMMVKDKVFELYDEKDKNTFSKRIVDVHHYFLDREENNNENNEFFKSLQNLKRTYEEYLDSEPMEFDGDIIITDPCYIMKEDKIDYSTYPNYKDYHKYDKEKDYPDYIKSKGSKTYQEESAKYDEDYKAWNEKNQRDWDKCDCGYELEVFGIYNYMTRDTLYGDWSCTTYNTDTKEAIGQFCADAGLVSVINLDEVLKYNKDFDYHINRDWTTTLIKDFKGTVQFIVTEERGFYEEDTKYWKKGEEWIEYEVKVVGHGINKVTGEPINFIGTQTGL